MTVFLCLTFGIAGGAFIGQVMAHLAIGQLYARIEALDARLTRQHRQIAKMRMRITDIDDELQDFVEQFEPTEVVFEHDDDADWWKEGTDGRP